MTEQDTWNGAARTVIVAYTSETGFRLLRFLRPGFRHCFAIVHVAPYWVVMDSLSDRIALAVLCPRTLADYLVTLHARGYRCQVARARRARNRRLRLSPFSCVEVVKRLLGITNPLILTPFHLFCHISVFDVDIRTQNINIYRSGHSAWTPPQSSSRDASGDPDLPREMSKRT